MKIFKLLLVAAVTGISFAGTAQTADEVLAKYYAAIGGTEKLNGINSLKMTGSMSAQGYDFPITVTTVHGKGMRMDLDIMSQNNYIIATPTKGYSFFPVQGMSEPAEMPAEQLSGQMNGLNLHGTLSNYKERGSTLEYLGTAKEDGVDVVKVKVKAKDGKESTYFFDSKTNYLLKVKSIGAEGTETETSYSDVQTTPYGVFYPRSTTNPMGTITWEKIEINPVVDEKIFQN